jgi:predicted nucleotidyltransferase
VDRAHDLFRRAATAILAVAAGLMLAGCGGAAEGPSSAPATTAAAESTSSKPKPWFEEVGAERGLEFHHRSGHSGQFLMPEASSGGGGFFDMDDDGDLDAYLVQTGSLTDPAARRPGNQLYENLGDGSFRNVTEGSGAEDYGYGMGVACGDYDNDGDVDLYVTNLGPNVLLQNDGTGRFTDVTETAGVGDEGWGTSAGFLDYDRDGDLDLFLLNYINWSAATELECYNQMGSADYCRPINYDSPAMDRLYRNEGDGRSTDVTEQAGIAGEFGNGLGYVIGDFNGDEWLDIFVANDGVSDQLWINQRNGTFVDNALIAGCAVDLEGGVPKAGMGVTAGDLDDDGDLDLMVVNLVDETDSVYRNEGEYFTDVTARSGLGTVSRRFTRFGVGWIDLDNDGYLDLYQATGKVMRAAERYTDDPFAEPNLLFRGGPGGVFDEVEPRGGTAEPLIAASRAAAFGDFDRDGGIDILVVNRDEAAHLLHNVVHPLGNWIRFRVLEQHGRDAEGARVEIVIGPRTLSRDVRAGYSYQACNDPGVQVGLGEATGVDRVDVRWIDGTRESFGPFEAGQSVTLRHGEGR